ncbi:hypothetical protein KY290_036937 [Solanum tuberosum]|uniref:Uncharacterized protein n=1 Tax=Solanum tuberosum TaxID=4113 RepID=A0ABQ7TU30_SOLTU|nr:hypothetical protein KY290_036937 [Solanum tuberosum]
MIATSQTLIVVQRCAPFDVEVAIPRAPFTVLRSPPPIKYNTHVVPWDYGKGKAKVEETDVTGEVTRSGRIYTFKNLVQGSSSKSKPPIVELDEQGVWKKVQDKENSIVEQLTYVPAGITHEEVAKMVGQVFEAYSISFHEDDLPLEETSHNKALYISAQYQNKVVTKALLDSGSGLNIFPLSTLTKLDMDSAKIHMQYSSV